MIYLIFDSRGLSTRGEVSENKKTQPPGGGEKTKLFSQLLQSRPWSEQRKASARERRRKAYIISHERFSPGKKQL